MTEILNKSLCTVSGKDIKMPFFIKGMRLVRSVLAYWLLFPIFTLFVRPLWKGIGFILSHFTARVAWFGMALIELPRKKPGEQ